MFTEQNSLVEQYLPLADKIAYFRKKRLPKFVEIDEIKSAAYLGLVEAASRFQPSSNNTFTTFANWRINGAITDFLRKERYKGMQSEDATFVELRSKSEFDSEEILEFFEKSLGKYATNILRYYFFENYSMAEIAEKFQVSTSRISQLLRKYKNQIRQQWDYAMYCEAHRN